MALEDQMLSIWREVFQTSDIRADSDFFDLGGNSLHAVQLVERIEKDFGVVLPVDAVWDEGTPSGLTRLIEARQ